MAEPLAFKNKNLDFEKILTNFENFYKSQNLSLSVKVNPDMVVSASAEFDGNFYRVIVNQGLLSKTNLTVDALRIILCHEAGHLYGGAPRRSIPMEWDGPIAPDGKSYISSEGESDYYAAATCFRKFVDYESQLNPFNFQLEQSTTVFHPILKKACEATWGKNTLDSIICMRTAKGAEEFLKLMFNFPISFDTPSREVADETITETYPSRQCRLDTYLAGAVCPDYFNLKFDFNNSKTETCSKEHGRRPVCWFKF